MAVKENELTKKLSDTHDEDWWFRMVDALGNSKDMLKSLLRLDPSQIEGLVSALASLSTIPVIKSQTAYIKTDGTINGSGTELKMLTNEAGLNAAFDGFYSVVTPFLVADLGYIKNVIAFDNSVKGQGAVTPSVRTMSRQLIFSTLGILYREYSSSTWGVPIFMGGTNDNFVTTYSALSSLATANKLTPGTLYKITDHGNDNGIIIQAATSSTFKPDGIRLGLVPAHYIAGTYSTVAWLGVWRLSIGDGGVAAGNKAVYMGRVWTNLTGNIGTVHADPDLWALDATNWALSTDSADYVQEVFGCTYRLVSNLPATYPKGYISKQWDSRGNSFGIEIEPATLFLVDYNDWGNAFVWGNKLKSCRNNICGVGQEIYNNNGNGDIHDNSALIYENTLTDENNNIRFNSYGNVLKNTLLGDADIDNNSNASVGYCTVCGDIKNNSYCYIQYTKVGFNGKIKGCTDFTYYDSVVDGIFENNSGISVFNSIITRIAIYKGKTASSATINNSILVSNNSITEIISENVTASESLNNIIAESYFEQGEFDIANGSSYSYPYNEDVGSRIDVCANGISVGGTTIADTSFTCKYAGWYKPKAVLSATSSLECNLSILCHVNGSTAKGNVFAKIGFSTSGGFIQAVAEGRVLLAVGDIVTFKFKHDYASSVTITGQVDYTLEYDN